MATRKFLYAGIAAVIYAAAVFSEESTQPGEWDQKKAIQKVREMIALEEKGDFPWEKIPWLTDPQQAAALAQKEQKPIFVYFYLKRNVGPAKAPC
ncbi:MAG: hypothetical protein RMJ82_02550 [Gemmatales bacterium]|nr:hypothetical protein [Gemmatales bacterium]